MRRVYRKLRRAWRRWAIVMAVVVGVLTDAQAQSQPQPPPVPSPVAIPTRVYSDAWQFMATAAAQVNQLPDQVTQNRGTSIIPAYDATSLFGYAKWLMSGNSTASILGQTLAPLANNMLFLLLAVLSLTAVYILVRLITLIFRAGVWLMFLLFRIIQLVVAVLTFLRSLVPFI